MFRQAPFIITASVLLALPVCAPGQDPARWIFEGLITQSDPALAPDLQSGWVLSGSFSLDSLEMEEEFSSGDGRSGRIVGGVTDAELTVDLYHQVLFAASQQPGLAGFDYQDNNPEENGRDLFGWFLPVGGRLGETRWSSSWLQIWLMDPEGDMIRRVPARISPYGIEWKSGWFRLTFHDESGESVHADGRIEYFGPESGLDDAQDTQWYAVAADLSRQLVERDSTIRLLEKELSDLNLRLDGLRRMVDLLVEERARLQEDNTLLRERAEAADPQVIRKVAELTAEKSLLESQMEDLSGKNESLLGKLDQSERERRELLQRMAELEAQLAEPAVRPSGPGLPTAVDAPAIGSVESLDGTAVPPMTGPEPVAEQSQPEQPQPPEPVAPDAAVPVEPIMDSRADADPIVEEPVAEPAQKKSSWPSRRLGPRKFR